MLFSICVVLGCRGKGSHVFYFIYNLKSKSKQINKLANFSPPLLLVRLTLIRYLSIKKMTTKKENPHWGGSRKKVEINKKHSPADSQYLKYDPLQQWLYLHNLE